MTTSESRHSPVEVLADSSHSLRDRGLGISLASEIEIGSIEPERGGLSELSAINIATIRQDFTKQAVAKGAFVSVEEVAAALHDSEEALRGDHKLTVNMYPESVRRLFDVGRMETYWGYADQPDPGALATTNGKSHHGRYRKYRQIVEDGIRPYVPANVQDLHPVHAAIAGPNDVGKGAAPNYGDWWVELDPTLADVAVYHFSDTHSSVGVYGQDQSPFIANTVLNRDDALRSKAIADLIVQHNTARGARIDSIAFNVDPDALIIIDDRRSNYVEAMVYADVTLDKIPSIGTRLIGPRQLEAAAPLLSSTPGALAEKLTVHLGDNVEPHAAEWIRRHYTTVPIETAPSDATAPGLLFWEELGVTPDDTHMEISSALEGRMWELWADLSRIMGGDTSRENLPSPGSEGLWDAEYSLKELAKIASDDERTEINKFIALQRARIFFRHVKAR